MLPGAEDAEGPRDAECGSAGGHRGPGVERGRGQAGQDRGRRAERGGGDLPCK